MTKILNNILILAGIAFFNACSNEQKIQVPLKSVPFTDVHLNDAFWAPKIEINRTVSIPSAFKKSEETGRMDNFALAGNLIKTEHQGDFPFDDTDVYKILEGASYALAVQPDPKLESYLDSLIVLIAKAQEEDGYLFTCVTNKCERLKGWYGKGRWDRLNSHELYNCGHLYEAAVAHYQATGKHSLLNVAIKNADLINEVFGPGENQKKVPSGHPIIEMALVKLYHVTNDEKYLKLARFFIDETGVGTDGHKLNMYSQDHMPVRQQEEAVGHAVRLGYLYSGITDVASLMHDNELIEASRKVWNNVVSKKLYITGGIGSRGQGEGFGPNYDLPNMTSYCETCASIANVYWNYRLFLHEADAKYFDILERTLYNGLIAGVSLSGDHFFYDNPMESEYNHERAPWFGCACCPGNVTRFMASVPGYLYTTAHNSLYVNLYAGSTAKVNISDIPIEIIQKTKYPWEGKVEITVNPEKSTKFNIHIRIPGWAQNVVVPSDLYRFSSNSNTSSSILINGEKEDFKLQNGYAVISKTWNKGDIISIEFPMEVRKVLTIDSVYNNKGKLALQRGPIVYCLEDKDNNNESVFDKYISQDNSFSVNYEDNLLGGIVTLIMKGYKLTDKENTLSEPVELKAIPYYSWNNRGKSSMKVWIPYKHEAVDINDKNTFMQQASAEASNGWVAGLDDGFTPARSTDTDKSYFYWWLKEGTEEWVEYRFDEPITLSSSSVYWLKMDHYDVKYDVPENWNLTYLNQKNEWVPVENNNEYETKPDQYNTVNFKPIKTLAIRLNAKLAEGYSGGIHEWKIN
jgi:DUF1680 family protein